MKFSKIFTMCLLSVLCFSCSSIDEPVGVVERANEEPRSRSIDNLNEKTPKEEAMEQFAIIFSKAVHENKAFRTFLKESAMAKFDMNSDVLYVMIKDCTVGGQKVKDILLKYTTEEALNSIESTIPLLNILIPEIDMFGITVENLDCNDANIPVALNVEGGMALYINGKEETIIPNGSLPDFHSFVINENSRVLSASPSRGEIEFVSPNFDARNAVAKSDMVVLDPSNFGLRAVQAFTYFNGYDADEYSIALQRDYIYYGMTPSSERGEFNNAVTEYIATFSVNPKEYFKMSDQFSETGSKPYDDPHIIKNSVSRKKKKYTEEELIKRMWSQGAYEFRFEIYSSNSSRPVVVYLPFKPEELWNFNIDTSYIHGTLFRDKKYTYKIDPDKFTARQIDISPKKINLGKWDLSKEATERFISIYEEDKSATYSETFEYEVNTMTTSKINGSVKFGLGTDFVSGNVSTEIGSSTTTREKKTFTNTRKEEDDALGTMKVYFYDPIIEAHYDQNRFIMSTYNTGVVEFSITADYM